MIDACCGFSSLLTKTSLRSASVAAIVIWVVFYVRVVNEEYQRYTQTGDYVPGVANQGGPLHWKLKNLRTAAQEINRIARPGESVISTWPGYLVETTAEIYPGLENHFAISISHKLSPAERKRFHVISRQGFVDLVQDRAAPIVVLGYRSEKQGIRKTLNVAGYKRVTPQQPLHGVAIYRLP